MTKKISSEAALKKALEDILERIIKKVSEKILKQLQKDIIENVYKSHSPNRVYFDNTRKPTMEFYRAWKWDEVTRGVNELTRTLFHDWESMGVDEGGYKHSSVSANWPIDTRQFLPEYLNVDGHDSSLWISVTRRPFWDCFLEKMFTGGMIDKWFEEELKKAGMIKN
jgi:hypothetical protein